MAAIGTLPVLFATGIHASRPAASAVGKGGLYSCTTHSLVYQTDGSSWTTWANLAGTGGSGTLTTVEEVDTSPTDSAVTKLVFPNGTLGIVGHVATYTPAAASSPLLAVIKYAPANTTFQQTSATLADADAVNLAITFTAPASGNVIVRLTGAASQANGVVAGSRGYWGLRESTTVLGGPTYVCFAQTGLPAQDVHNTSVAYYLTGVSAGSHTYKWAIAGDGTGNAGLFVGTAAPAVMEVWAA